MNIILKAINAFFVVLGVLFMIQIVLIAYVVIKDPLNLKPFINTTGFSPTTAVKSMITGTKNISDSDVHPLLTDEQETQLQAIGIDPAVLPTELSPAMQECFVRTLGQNRVDEIAQSGSPTPADYFNARECL